MSQPQQVAKRKSEIRSQLSLLNKRLKDAQVFKQFIDKQEDKMALVVIQPMPDGEAFAATMLALISGKSPRMESLKDTPAFMDLFTGDMLPKVLDFIIETSEKEKAALTAELEDLVFEQMATTAADRPTDDWNLREPPQPPPVVLSLVNYLKALPFRPVVEFSSKMRPTSVEWEIKMACPLGVLLFIDFDKMPGAKLDCRVEKDPVSDQVYHYFVYQQR